jgi:acyl carrier protein
LYLTPELIQNNLIDIIKNEIKRYGISPDTPFIDMDLDSLDFSILMMEIEHKYSIDCDKLPEIETYCKDITNPKDNPEKKIENIRDLSYEISELIQ